jgi:uncharacterized protein YndB with AHSA1/START domain
MNTQQNQALHIRLRVLRTTPERAFAAWTRPEHLRRWSAPEGLSISEGEMDLRVGGQWRVVMEEEGGTRHEAFGTYREIAEPERLVYTHAWRREGGSTPETTVTIQFLPDPAGTRLVLTQEGFGSEESRDGHLGGWSSALDKLTALFDGGHA